MKELSSVSNPIVKAAAELKQKTISDRTAGFFSGGNAIGGGSCKLWYSETAFCA